MPFCKEYNILISTSLDGPEAIHNKNRKTSENDSFQRFCTNLELVRNNLGGDKISALLTVSLASLKYPTEIIDEYRKLGFASIFIRALNPYGRAQNDFRGNADYLSEFLNFYKTALEYILELNKSGIVFAEEYARIILAKILTPFSVGFTDLQSPAGVINSVAVYDYDGYIYPSDEARMTAAEGDPYFRLGHVMRDSYKDIFYGQKAQKISQSWSNESLAGCSECAFQSYCGADPVRNYVEEGDMEGFRPENMFCFKNKNVIKLLFELMNDNKENEGIFRRWING